MMVKEREPQRGQQFLLRFPEGSDLRDRIARAANKKGRSVTAEIVFALEKHLQGDALAVEERLRVVEASIKVLSAAIGLSGKGGK